MKELTDKIKCHPLITKELADGSIFFEHVFENDLKTIKLNIKNAQKMYEAGNIKLLTIESVPSDFTDEQVNDDTLMCKYVDKREMATGEIFYKHYFEDSLKDIKLTIKLDEKKYESGERQIISIEEFEEEIYEQTEDENDE